MIKEQILKEIHEGRDINVVNNCAKNKLCDDALKS